MRRSTPAAVLRLAAVWAASWAWGCGQVRLVMEADATLPPTDGRARNDGNQIGPGAEMDGRPDGGLSDTPPAPAVPVPPATWTEHWFEHDQTLDLVAYSDDVVIYFDRDVPRAGAEWMLPFLSSAWRYTQLTYGDFKPTADGDGRFYAIFHQGRYAGCHAGYYQESLHDNRSVSDCGPGPWTSPTLIGPHFDPLWWMGSMIERSSNHFFTSPIGDVWGNYFKEIYMYDVFVAVGRASDAQAAYDVFMASVDPDPQMPAHWFRDWFFPVWRDHGHAQVLAKFFKLLAQFSPATMTLPEMVHFMSGAAGVDLTAQAVTAFGAGLVSDADIQKARADYPAITYPRVL